MTREQLSDWWCERGTAWDAIARAETALLNALRVRGDEVLDRRVLEVLGALAGSRALLVQATERAEHLARAATPQGAPAREKE
jgi:hypothetical protein